MRDRPWGIEPGYWDTEGVWHKTSSATRATLLAAMGVDAAEPEGTDQARVSIVRAGTQIQLRGPAELILEDGSAVRVGRDLPPDLPLGYHGLEPLDGSEAIRLIVAPPHCYLPDGLRTWGWATQLYALRSLASWGIGDLGDLARLAAWSARELAAGLVLVNPLGAPLPVLSQQASPYFPSTRRFRNPLYLRIEDVPGAGDAGLELERLAAAGRALNANRLIDRDAVFRLKIEALEQLWRRFPGDPAFDRYRATLGRSLTDFAIYCALAEHHGAGWPDWPEEHRRPTSPAVARFAAEHANRVAFHEWLQWLLDEQLRRAGAHLPIVQDLPVGVDPAGADAWVWHDVLARDVTVGAPPDAFNMLGQDWGLPPFVPHRLREAAYVPFVETVRASLRHAGGLRIDHVMGLFRLYWVPRGMGPTAGAYVRYPADDLLAIVALESQRAGAYIIGEDLGTVEPAVRKTLAAQKILSYRLLWFEREPPPRYPKQALSAVTTHDLPTIAGLWSGVDLAAQLEIGLQPNEEGTTLIRNKLQRLTGVAADADPAEVVVRTHAALAEAPSAILTATLDDALAVAERPNMPGTVSEWPNWCIALPMPLEEIEQTPLPRAVAAALARRSDRRMSDRPRGLSGAASPD